MEIKKNNRVLFYICLIFIVAVIFGAISFHFLKYGDFPQHIGWAKDLSENGYMYKIPHTLFHRLVVIVRGLLPANLLVWVSVLAKQVYDLKSFEISTLIVIVLAHLSTAIILVYYLTWEWQRNQSKKVIWWAGLCALIVMLVAPVYIFSLPQMSRGYAVANRFDNPTYIVLKPFVLLMFISITRNLFAKWNWKYSLWMAGFVLCATLAKPSFTITIIPSLGIVLALFYLKKWRQINFLYLLFPIGLTALIVLVGQFAINFTGDRGDQVIFAPFASLLILVKDIPTIILFQFTSFLFPLSVYSIYWREAKKDLAMQLVGINLLISLAMGILLSEKINMAANNFWNSVQIGTFLLFSVSVGYYGKHVMNTVYEKMKLTWKDIIPGVLLALHLGCGIAFFVISFMTNGIVK